MAEKDNRLLDTVAAWLDWKLHALCLDESDLRMMEVIARHRREIKRKKKEGALCNV